MKKAVVAIALAAISLTLVGCGDDTKEAPTKVAVRAGVNDPDDRNIALLAFLPASVTVKAGASVEWTAPGPEPHTITFLPLGETPPTPDKPENAALRAETKSGDYTGAETLGTTIIPTGPDPVTYEVKFPKAGEFTYYCIIHPGMQGEVNVVDDDADADQQDAIDDRGEEEEADWLAEGRAAKKALTEAEPKKTSNADGSTTYTVEMGTNTAHTAVLAFQPVDAVLKAGDKVTFINNSGDPHTASFAGTKGLPQNPEGPEAMAPAPGPSPQALNATDMFNTGWLPPNAPPGAGPPEAVRSYTYTVPTAGVYSYVCLLHAPSGMGGKLTVT